MSNQESSRIRTDARPRWLGMLVGRLFPKWEEDYRGPITQHLYYGARKVGEQQATLIRQTSRDGRHRYFIDEGDGLAYPMSEKRLFKTTNKVDMPTSNP